MSRLAARQGTAIVTGIIERTQATYNGMIVRRYNNQEAGASEYQQGNANRYHKHHLLPIGEYVPLEDWLRPIAPWFNLPV